MNGQQIFSLEDFVHLYAMSLTKQYENTILLSRLIYFYAWESSNQDGRLHFPYFGTTSALKCVCNGSATESSSQEPQLRLTECYSFSRLTYSGQRNGLVFFLQTSVL